MPKAKPKSKQAKPDPRLEAVREAIGDGNEIDQLWRIDQALGRGERAAIAREVLSGEHGSGAVAAWLRILAGSGTAADDLALAELCTRATSGRMLLMNILSAIEARLDDAIVARSVAQLEVAAPFAPLAIGRGRAVVRAAGDVALADRMDARAAFVARHAALLADLSVDAKEKAQDAATAALDKLAGDDRDLAAHWVLTTEGTPRNADRWARLVAITSSAIPVLIAADGLNEKFIHDDEEAALGAAVTTAGPAALARATEILNEAVVRGWSQVIEHLAPAVPAAFATPAGFDAVMRGLAREDGVTDRLCEDARSWVRALGPVQAAQVAERLIALCELSQNSDHVLHQSAPRACFYFENPGGLAVFAAALDREISDHTRDQIYDAIENIETRDAQDVLIDRLFVESRCLRDLVYAFNKACMPQRHADVLARLDAKPSFDAAWIYIACQMHWAHRPRHVLDVVERVLAWPKSGTAARRANVMSQAVVCALELRRYALARRCLELLGEARTCDDPTEHEPSNTVLADKDFTKQLSALRAGKLEAKQAAVADTVAKLRAAGKPRAADDELLGMLAGGMLGLRLHTDARTHDAWFFDQEGAFFCYDGFGITPPPFELVIMQLANGWDIEVPGLAAFCASWHTTARSLHVGGGDAREVLLGNDRILVRYHPGHHDLVTWRVFGLRFRDADAARRAFDAMHAHPAKGNRTVDPFYVPGARGGTFVREYGNDTTWGYVVGSEVAFGDVQWKLEQRPCGSRERAAEKFAEVESEWLRRGLFPRKLEQDSRIRPLDDLPLAKWLDDRERDDEKGPGWHLEALPAIMAAIEVTELPLEAIEISLGPPATAAELAAYDAALPEPMPDAMREMWTTAGTARWQVGDRIERLLSPAEVLRERETRRADLAKRIATVRGAAKLKWEPQFLDVFIVNGDESWLAFDVRQEQNDSFYEVGTTDLGYHSSSALHWMLAERFASDFVDALIERFPELKKLKYGQTIADLLAKPAKAKKKKPKPAAKAKPQRRRR